MVETLNIGKFKQGKPHRNAYFPVVDYKNSVNQGLYIMHHRLFTLARIRQHGGFFGRDWGLQQETIHSSSSNNISEQ